MQKRDDRRARLADFDFRGIHERLHFGTASDRYAGWLGQIYARELWGDRVSSRKRRLGGESFVEEQVPIDSVHDYFRHFSTLELDFTFYRPLLEDGGEAGSNYFVLRRYAEAAPADARFILKAPQAYSARVLRSDSGYAANQTYLDAEGLQKRFLEPALGLLGQDRLAGVLFEQEYNRVSSSPEPEEFAGELDSFLDRLPAGGPQLHFEIRSPHMLSPQYFALLRERGAGFCFSHWTYLPAIKKQWEMAGGSADMAFSAQNGEVVMRLLTPRGMPYAEAYKQSHPFDRALPSISESAEGLRMVDEATALVIQALESGRTANVIVNNRAWGNAPLLAQAIGARFMEFAVERGL